MHIGGGLSRLKRRHPGPSTLAEILASTRGLT